MSTLRTYAQLCRLPAVFTAIADIFLGYLLTHEKLTPVDRFLALVAASAGLYLAGMVLNDVFDRYIDARERPKRPIPSGRVPVRNAIAFAVVLIAVGLGAAAFAGRPSLFVALILLANILLYDGGLKKTPLGPVAMGGCRFFNIILGASAAGAGFNDAFQMPQFLVAVGMGVYVMGVTLFARNEAERSRPAALTAALVVVNLGLLIQAVWIAPQGDAVLRPLGWQVQRGVVEPWRALAILGAMAVVLNRRAIGAILNPSPALVQNTIRSMLLSIITLDAMLIYNRLGDAGIPFAAGVFALLVPSLALGRWMSMT